MLDAEPLLTTLARSFTTGRAKEVGLSHHVLTRLVRSGRLERAGHGVYRQVVPPTAAAREWERRLDEHRQRCAELLLRRPGHAISHLSAALLHGLPVSIGPTTPVEATSVARAPQSRLMPSVLLHHCDSLENDTVDIDGLCVTTAARTIADVARQHPLTVSVPLLDAAARTQVCSPREVEEVLTRQRHWTGRSRGFQAVQLADARRESWLESYSFVELNRLGLTMPVPQVEVFDRDGHFVARVDGFLLDSGVVLECDGADKYLADANSQEIRVQVTRLLMAQNQRQLALEALGLTVVRWTTVDITRSPQAVLDRVRRAARHSNIGRFTGRLRVDGVWLT